MATKSKTTPKPIKTGLLDRRFRYEDVTPTIGREYQQVNIVDNLLHGPESDELLRDLGITISERGVVFFRAQDNLDEAAQKALIQRLGELTGKPATATLHVHPVMNSEGDAEISRIDSRTRRALYGAVDGVGERQTRPEAPWHCDSPFEPDPPGYTSLRLVELPRNGGDTLWASGYDLYDRLSPPLQAFLETLSITWAGEPFLAAARAHPDRVRLFAGPRGSPRNVGTQLRAVHPVVRTHPVTGWKSVFAVGPCAQYINGLAARESECLLRLLRHALVEHHDLMLRFKWRNKNDIAIWDNRCTYHSATYDYDGLGPRAGVRAVGIHEAPYLDPRSTSKARDLEQQLTPSDA